MKTASELEITRAALLPNADSIRAGGLRLPAAVSAALRLRAAVESARNVPLPQSRVLALLALLAVSPMATVTAQMPPPSVRFDVVETKEMQARHRVTGSIRAAFRSRVAAREAAAVTELLVREGDPVQAGQPLLRFDTARLEAELREAEAGLAASSSSVRQAEAEALRAEEDFKMQDSLHRSGATARTEFLHAARDRESAQARLQASRSAVTEAESRVERIAVRLRDLSITAPFDGRVVERHVEAGEWLEPGDSIVTVVSDRMEAWLTVPERYADPVREFSRELVVEPASSGTTFVSDQVRIVPDVDVRARTFPVVAEFPNEDGSLSAGMSVTAWVPGTDKREELVVDRDAIVRHGASAHVMKLDRSSEPPIAVAAPVRVLFQDGRDVAVASAQLRAGDEVIVEGNERLAPNSPVQPAAAERGVAALR